MVVAIYSRKSAFTGKGDSIGNQIEMCKDHALAKFGQGVQFLIYEDEGFSGGNTERPKFQELMRDIKLKLVNVLICYRLDRITRNVLDFSNILELLQENKVDFLSLRESFDTTTPMGRAMIYIAAVFAQLERETIAERLRDNKYKLAELGRWIGGYPPWGYISRKIEYRDDGGSKRSYFTLEQVAENAAKIRQIFDEFLISSSVTQLESRLIKMGIRSGNDEILSDARLREILLNLTYVKNDACIYDYLLEHGVNLDGYSRADFDGKGGLISYCKTKMVSAKKRQRTPMSEWIVGVSEHMGIIDGEVWIAAHKKIKANAGKFPRANTSQMSLFSFMITCGNCGAPMSAMGQTKYANGENKFYYRCTNKVRSHGELCDTKNITGRLFDSAVVEKLRIMLRNIVDHPVAKNNLKRSKPPANNLQKEIIAIKKKIADNESAIKNLIKKTALLDDEFTPHIQATVKDIAFQNTTLNNELLEKTRAINAASMAELNDELFRERVQSFFDKFDALDMSEKKTMLGDIIEKIVWDGESFEIIVRD